MRFLQPSLFLLWSALIIVPIVLYLFRPRPRTVRTSTLPFFKWLAREHQDSAWLKRLKQLLSLLLTLLVILGAAGALGRLVVAPSAESLKTVVIVVDRSASMAAGNEQTRLDEAVSTIQDRLAGLPAGIGVIVMAYDSRPEVLLSRTLDRRRVERALASITVRPVAGDAAKALELAKRLAALETPAGIWHVTDTPDAAVVTVTAAAGRPSVGRVAGSGDPPTTDVASTNPRVPVSPRPPITVETISFPLAEPVNVGLTAFQLRRRPLERAKFEAFVQVHSAAQKTIEAELEVKQNGELVEIRKLTLEPGSRESLLIPVDADESAEKILTLKITTAGDVLPTDDVIQARIPKVRPVRVLWISTSPDPFTELALTSLAAEGDMEVLQGGPGAWPPKEAVDVAIFDDWMPAKWPKDVSAVVINPTRSSGPVQAVRLKGDGLPAETMRVTRPAHPLLFGVASGRISLMQTAVVEADGPLQPLWVGDQGPLLLAGEDKNRRVVVMPFAPQLSEQLQLTASYPLLIGNAIYWAAENSLQASRGLNLRSGELIELEGKTLTWIETGNDGRPVETPFEVEGRWVELDRVGLWKTENGETGSASLLAVKETLIPSRPKEPQSSQNNEATGLSFFRGDMAPWLIWTVVLILVVESWMYHRYAAY